MTVSQIITRMMLAVIPPITIRTAGVGGVTGTGVGTGVGAGLSAGAGIGTYVLTCLVVNIYR